LKAKDLEKPLSIILWSFFVIFAVLLFLSVILTDITALSVSFFFLGLILAVIFAAKYLAEHGMVEFEEDDS